MRSENEQSQRNLGILVFGFKRPNSLGNVLESLRLQGYSQATTVFIDGDLHRSEYSYQCNESRLLQNIYTDCKFLIYNGNYGIERLMIDGLQYAFQRFNKIIVLEDDCFPSFDAVELFNQKLNALPDGYFSVYGHPFGIENEEGGITRFQGWGWATTQERLGQVLPILKFLYALDEHSYLDFIAKKLEDQSLIDKLSITPPRNCIDVLKKQFTWDSAISLICADLNLLHQYTNERIIFNCGMGGGTTSGHFRQEESCLREPPFNMILEEEVWQCFNKQLPMEIVAQKTFGLDGLDLKLREACSPRSSFFIELGAYDGVTQSNSLLFERKGFKCLLIEPSPVAFPKLCANRPTSINENVACTSSPNIKKVEIHELGLMSIGDELVQGSAERDSWYSRAQSFMDHEPFRYEQSATTLSQLISKHGFQGVGILSLDVEGAELEVLKGLDFELFEIEYLCIEMQKADPDGEQKIHRFLESKGLSFRVLQDRKFTKDVLFYH
jgi:FkbM family methyltransferase